MRLWRLGLLVVPGALVLSTQPQYGLHSAQHGYVPLGSLSRLGMWGRSCVTYGASLCNLFFFETLRLAGGGVRVGSVLGYAFNEPTTCLFFWVPVGGRRVGSLEVCFRNLRWLEREAGELLGIFFTAKVDRRALFTPSYLYTAPLRKAFPTGGFYELVLNPLVGGLTLVRNGCA